MPRYIDADALLEEIKPGKIMSSDSVRYKIITAPTADVQEVKHGHWFKPSEMSENICSNCKRSIKTLFSILSDYCPNCGAIMDQKEKEE